MNEADPLEGVHHGGALVAACAEFGGAPQDWLDLSTGINPIPIVLPEFDASVWQRLPDDDLRSTASAAAAAYYGTADRVLPLPVAGTQSAIQLLPGLFDGRVAVFGPTYEEFRFCFERVGRAVDIISVPEQIVDHHKLVIAVNPNNPDGRILKRDAILALCEERAQTGGYVVVDEAFADAQTDESVAAMAGQIHNLVVLRSFGKFFGLAGLRLGFVLAAPAILHRMQAAQGPWAVSGPALALAARVLNDPSLCAKNRTAIGERNLALRTVLQASGLRIVGGTPLFALVRHKRAADLYRLLCGHRILTRSFAYEPQWLRIGLAPDASGDARLRAALADIRLAE
ncbi:MAG: threonine-phosphate decarboxylase CobD [Pseudomonadota bacterium]